MFNTREEKTVKHTNSTKGADHKESTVKEAVQKATDRRKAAAAAEAEEGKKAFGNLIRNLPRVPILFEYCDVEHSKGHLKG